MDAEFVLLNRHCDVLPKFTVADDIKGTDRAVEHPLVATSSPVRFAGVRVPGDYAKCPPGRSCAEQRSRGRGRPG
jgi:hypothetical protein